MLISLINYRGVVDHSVSAFFEEFNTNIKLAIGPYHTILSYWKSGHTIPYNIPYMLAEYGYVRYLKRRFKR